MNDVATHNTWVIPATPFASNNILYSVGGTWSLGTQGFSVPIAGYYEITFNIFFNAVTGDHADHADGGQ